MNQWTSATAIRAGNRQPSALFPLGLTELCERAAFFGLQAVLFLYLRGAFATGRGAERIWGFATVEHGLAGMGAHSPTQQASMFFGGVTGLLYLSTVAGGGIADRLRALRGTIVAGAVLSVAGYFLIAFERSFLAGVVVLILGHGAFKGNIASEVARLYARNDPRREAGFALFFMAVHLGVLGGPLLSGALGQAGRWPLAFSGCGLAALLSLATYLASIRLNRRRGGQAPAVEPAAARSRHGWSRRKAGALAVVLLAMATVFIGAQQIYSVYVGWAAQLGLNWGGRPIPATWLLALDTALELTMLSLTGRLWSLWRRLAPEPGPVARLGIGALLVGAGFALLANVPDHAGARALPWLVAFHAVNGLGYAIIYPVGLATLTRAAPDGSRSTVAGLFYLQTAVAAVCAGLLGQGWERLGSASFWILHAALFAGAGLVLIAWSRPLAAALGLEGADGARPCSNIGRTSKAPERRWGASGRPWPSAGASFDGCGAAPVPPAGKRAGNADAVHAQGQWTAPDGGGGAGYAAPVGAARHPGA